MAATARDGRCVIEVVNTVDRTEPVPAAAALGAPSADPVPATAEHGRGLKIIDAVTDNLQLTGNGQDGTTVHFEKVLSWLPGAAASTCSAAALRRRGVAGPAGPERLSPLATVQHICRGPPVRRSRGGSSL